MSSINYLNLSFYSLKLCIKYELINYIVYTHKLQFLPKMLATNLIGYSLIYFGQNLAIKLVVP